MSTPARMLATSQPQLDHIDRRIIEELQREARLTNVELSQRVHLSPSPCLARVRALEQAGVIERYVALAAPRALGLTVCAFIHVTLDKQIDKALEVFEHSVRSRREILECYLMTGDHDYVLRVVVQDVEELQHLIVDELSRIPGVANIRSSLALKEVKYETALPVEHDKGPISSRGPRARC